MTDMTVMKGPTAPVPAIDIHGLSKTYRTRGKTTEALRDLTLTVADGEFFSLLGVNGAGKTTAIKCLTGLTPPTGGDARLCGHSIRTEADTTRRFVSTSPQTTAVAPNLTVRENLALAAGLWGIPRGRIAAAVADIIDRLGLDKVAADRARTLSGGWQRRLSIAMALVTAPRILFLDEPTLGLDVLARRELWEVIRTLRGHTTVVLTTHYLEEADALSDRIGILAGGTLRALGTAADLCALAGKDRFEDAFVELAARPLDPPKEVTA